MIRFFQTLITLISVLTNAGSQILPLNLPPKADSMPEWAQYLYENPINIIKVEDAYHQYYINHTFEKNQYTRFYKRLVMNHQMQIQENGDMVSKNYRELEERSQINKSRSPVNEWKPYEMETFFLENNTQACPWQVNVYRMDVCRAQPSFLVASSETGGLFKSTDKGRHWTQIGRQFALGTEAIAIHPRYPDTIYVGTGNSIRRSADGGNSWTTLFSYTDAGFYEILVMPSNPGVILAGTSKGLFRSADYGKTWTRILDESVCDIKAHPTKTNTVYCLRYVAAAKQYQVWKSGNAGGSFFAKTTGWHSLQDGGARMATTLADPSRLYVIALTNSSGPYLMRSDDEAENWNIRARGSYTGYNSTAFPMDNWQGYYDLAIMASQTNADQLITGTGSTFKSTDGGSTFEIIGGYGGKFSLHPDLQTCVSLGTDSWIGTDGGLTYSDDFFTEVTRAESRNKGLYGSDFWGFDAGWNEKLVVGGRYHNGNTVWHENYNSKFIRMGGAESATGYVNPVDNRQIFFSDIGAYELPFQISSGWKWNSIASSIWPNESYYPMEFSRMVWSPQCYHEVYLGKGNSLYRSINNGASFTPIYSTPNASEVLEFIEICRSNPNVIYITTRNNSASEGLCYRSSDGGNTFEVLNTPPSTTGGQRRVHRLVASPTNENEIYLALRTGNKSNKVFRSIDGGKSWTNWTTVTIENISISDICLQYGTNSGVYLSGDDGQLFYRNLSMADWKAHNAGLGINHFTRQLKPFYRDGLLLNGSNMGVWEIPFFEDSKPLAQPSVDRLSSFCVRDSFYFADYSVLHADSSTRYTWNFPGAAYVSDNHSSRPVVVFGSAGDFDVSLSVQDQYGSDSKTIKRMIHIGQNECNIDSTIGHCLDLSKNDDKATIGTLSALNNASGFSCMAWIKLNSKQDCFTQILANWDSDAGMGFGFAFQGYVTTTNLTFSWKGVPYQLTSPFNLEINKWIHVAMVVFPDSIRLYHNGESWTYKGNFKSYHLGNTPWEIGTGVRGQCGNFNGQIDELKIYNRSLSADEIRKNMHLIHPEGENGLIAYYQFNESTPNEFYNRSGTSHALNGGGLRKISTAPAAIGQSQFNNVKLGDVNWDTCGLAMYFGQINKNNYPWIIFRLDAPADSLPSTTGSWYKSYYIARAFGSSTGETSTTLSVHMDGIDLQQYEKFPQYIKLFRRDLANEHLNTWKYVGNASAADAASGRVRFNSPGTLNGQYLIEVIESPLTGIGQPDDQHGDFQIYPNPSGSNITVYLRNNLQGNVLYIRNLQGQAIRNYPYEGSNEKYIEIQDLPRGIYYVEFGGTVQKLVIQ
ncbi:MAG: T9SS type A sorting domain-containing protein [Saprospiraceae bacterium]|nr:T9SS type A sorting domain-containing protein [Saprospiraceae bacterium]HMW39005.1 T9SS type A sorting domain-containing protein [Saprospiraceae bacterium]HMX87030.1 T9SS type A sorting domain-containing protein [Saprospiraceae bacterium]HMZ39791.1 T9SS type A sorting domain-containing protein [Saprospiraceae bacterium]HNA63523.1 T9SS type A sorting domain-containing protein [Saprospiraceae bacterium]